MQSTTVSAPTAAASPALQPTKVRWKIFLMMLFLISVNYIDRASLSVAMLDSWRTSFVVAGVATMVAGWFAWWYIRNHPRQHPGVNEAEATCIEASHAADKWCAAGASQAKVLRTLFGIASVIATVAIYNVARFKDPVTVVALLSVTLFFLRWCGLFVCSTLLIDYSKKLPV